MATSATITVLMEPVTIDGQRYDLKVETSFNKRWVEEFKQHTYPHRLWSIEAKAWYTEMKYFTAVCELSKRYFDLVEEVEGDTRTNLKTLAMVEQGRLF